MSSPEDRDFAAFAERGDLDALARVFDALAPALLGIASHLGPAAEAEDVVQATFLTAIEKARHYDGSRPLEPWLLGILTRHARRARRRVRRRADPARLMPPGPAEPPAHAEARELRRLLGEALGAMPSAWREVVQLRLAGISPREISVRLERPRGTVRAQLARAMAWLRERLPPSYRGAAFGSGVALGHSRARVLAHAAETGAGVGTAPSLAWLSGVVLVKRTAVVTVVLLGLAAAGLAVDWSAPTGAPAGPPGPAAVMAAARPQAHPPTAAPAAEPGAGRTPVERPAAAGESRLLVRGRCLRESDRAPIAGARVRLVPRTQPPAAIALFGPEPRPALLATTAADGSFALAGHLAVPDARLVVDHPAYATRDEPWDAARSDQVVLLRPGARVSGRIVDEGGEPVALEKFELPLGTPVAVDHRGRFDAGGLALGRHLPHVDPSQGFLLQPAVVEVATTGAPVETTLVVRPFPALSGRVVDRNGAPVCSAEVRIADPEQTENQLTDGAGRFRFTSQDLRRRSVELALPSCPYRVVAGLGSHRFGERDVEVVVDRGATLALQVGERGSGRPVEAYCVLCEPDPRPDPAVPLLRRHGEPHRGGLASVDGLAPGRWRLRVVPFDRRLAPSPWIALRFPPAESPLRIELVSCRPIEISVAGERGQPVPGARVELIATRPGGELGAGDAAVDLRTRAPRRTLPPAGFHELLDRGDTDATGIVRLWGPAASETRPCHVRVRGAVLPVLEPLPPGSTSVQCRVERAARLRVSLPAVLAGRLFDRVALERIDASRDDRLDVRADASGVFDSGWIAPGGWRLHPGKRIGRSEQTLAEVWLAPAEVRHLEFDPGPVRLGSVRGHLAAAAMLPDATVELIPDADRPTLRSRPTAGGDFELHDVPAGRYSLHVTGAGTEISWRAVLVRAAPVDVRDGAETRADFDFPCHDLELHAVDDRGADLAGQLLYVRAGSEQLGATRTATTLTDSRGIAHLLAVPRGPLRVTLQRGDELHAPVEFDVRRQAPGR